MYKHILLATDLCDSEFLLEKKAKQFSDLNQAKLSLIHAIEPLPAYGYPALDELHSPFIDRAKEKMKDLAGLVSVSDSDQHIVLGSLKSEILKFADEHDVDCIVIGTNRRNILGRVFLGSGAHAIVNGAPCDVLTLSINDEL